jgi:3-hydroxyacyl-CoA dehydrogenase/enoyl-CoA hydratase/3-hydroxybutyryl-CoA epimerase
MSGAVVDKADAAPSATALSHWRIATDDEGIAWLHLDKHGAAQNTLSREVITELGTALEQIGRDRPAGLVIASDKPGNFIIGADINEFTTLTDRATTLELIQQAHRVFNRLADLPMPTVAMIDGYCLGGGTELSLACRYRVAADNDRTRLGLPEVMLGIHPGFGGTARLIEIIGAPAGMDLMLTGRSIRPRQARSLGLVDMAVPERHLERAARRMVQKKPAPRRPQWWIKALNSTLARPLLARVMRKKVAARARREHYPAPYALIDLWQQHGGDKATMLSEEAQSVARLISGSTAQNLVRVFFLQENLKALGKTAEDGEKFAHVHVIGAGVMGGDIAAWCALQGLSVTIQDQAPEALARVVKRTHQLLSKRLREPRKITAAMDRFQPDLRGDGIRHADVVIEAIFENAEAKQQLFKVVEPQLKPDALLATNTSSIPLEDLASSLKNPSRLVGLHFFNPVAKMQLVEIVNGADTSADVAARAAAFTLQISRLPVPVKSAPGFLVNRILMPYLLEAVELLHDNVPAIAIDEAATEFGMPMGPIELADTVGLDICAHVAENLTASFGGNVPAELKAKVDAGKLGKKTGAGFYQWKNGKPEKLKKSEGEEAHAVPADLTDRMVLRFVNEAVACLREEIVSDADLLDAGVIFGTGFAPFRGGPMHYINSEGAARLRTRLESLADRYGERFTPDAGWQQLE